MPAVGQYMPGEHDGPGVDMPEFGQKNPTGQGEARTNAVLLHTLPTGHTVQFKGHRHDAQNVRMGQGEMVVWLPPEKYPAGHTATDDKRGTTLDPLNRPNRVELLASGYDTFAPEPTCVSKLYHNLSLAGCTGAALAKSRTKST